MNKILIGVAVVILVFVGILFFIAQDKEDSVRSQQETSTSSDGTVSEKKQKRNLGELPDVTLTNYEGDPIVLSDFIGTPLVINSWATWCPFCTIELPDLVEAQKEFRDEVIIISINRVESLKKAKKYTDDAGITDGIIFLLDSSDSFYRSIGGFTMPETIFVDETGVIRIHKRGFMKIDEIRQKINELIN